MKAPFLLGRLIFGGFFLYNGVNHIANSKKMAEAAKSKGVPYPQAAVIGSGALLLAGGTSIVLGIKPKLGALAIAGFLTGVTPVMHDFWASVDPQQKMNDLINFSKNVALMGATAALAGVDEPWPASVATPDENVLQRGKRMLGKCRVAA